MPSLNWPIKSSCSRTELRRIVMEHLDREMPGRWLGSGGPTLWPPRSPDLIPLDFFLCGYVKKPSLGRSTVFSTWKTTFKGSSYDGYTKHASAYSERGLISSRYLPSHQRSPYWDRLRKWGTVHKKIIVPLCQCENLKCLYRLFSETFI